MSKLVIIVSLIFLVSCSNNTSDTMYVFYDHEVDNLTNKSCQYGMYAAITELDGVNIKDKTIESICKKFSKSVRRK